MKRTRLKRKGSEQYRYVYGTRTKKWCLVGKGDRDWKSGITLSEMKSMGKRKSKTKYLSPKVIV